MRLIFPILLLIMCLPFRLDAQLSLEQINLEQIEKKSVRKYIKKQIKDGYQSIEDLKPSWSSQDDLSSYYKHVMTLSVDASLQKVWESYLLSDPSKVWNNKSSTKQLVLQKTPEKIYHTTDPISTTKIGQIYFLNLKLLARLVNMAVAFEIVTIDAQKRLIEFSYIEGNTSEGVQRIEFFALDEHSTEIIHTSYFKSGKRFRDRWVYPFFHKKLTTDFHTNVRKFLVLE